MTISSEIKSPLTSIFVIKSFSPDEMFCSFGKTRFWAQIMSYKATILSSWNGTCPYTKQNKVIPSDQISEAWKCKNNVLIRILLNICDNYEANSWFPQSNQNFTIDWFSVLYISEFLFSFSELAEKFQVKKQLTTVFMV